MKKIGISIGDLNGIGFSIAIKAHKKIKRLCKPIYFIDKKMAIRAAKKLGKKLPNDFQTFEGIGAAFRIKPAKVSKKSGAYSFASFKKGVELAKDGEIDAIVTLPIHKEAWAKTGIGYKGHTEYLRDIFKKEAIMMIGCDKLYACLFTQHIPLKEVPKKIRYKKLKNFLIELQNSLLIDKIAVLGLNPHAGDNGVIGDEERVIKRAIKSTNAHFDREIFYGPLVSDTAFSPKNRKDLRYFVAMYHDQGLIPVKTLYFKESINVTLNLPIVRTSVDHGTAFDIAYKKGVTPSTKSYINAIKKAIKLSGYHS